jgi:hypothetical protein
MKTVIKHFEGFEYMTPVLAFVIQSLVQYIHDLVEGCGTIIQSVSHTMQVFITYSANVNWAISAISAPVGPQASLLVAIPISRGSR